jgi:pilus assembly protein Flp/PilA
MISLFAAVKNLVRRNEEGATMVEYGLMLALIAIVCVGAVTAVGTKVEGIFNQLAGSM